MPRGKPIDGAVTVDGRRYSAGEWGEILQSVEDQIRRHPNGFHSSWRMNPFDGVGFLPPAPVSSARVLGRAKKELKASGRIRYEGKSWSRDFKRWFAVGSGACSSFKVSSTSTNCRCGRPAMAHRGGET